ncbi:hypothetical protein F4774DRAFT_54241 [Daldinia eschscholtzii]|nr:hypothetical protein F4774DRAFT_54241 [Daldinia eschscholtzii]
MAEAIATLSLVCNVMQVISFTGEVFNLCRNTFKDGSPTSNLASNTAHLSALVATLQERLRDYSNVKDESEGLERQAKARLKKLTSELIRDTTELQKLLGKVTITNSTGKTHSVMTVFKFKLLYSSDISSLEKRISSTRAILDSELLSKICSSTQASRCRSEDMYSDLRDDIKQFIDRWSNGQRTVSELLISKAQEIRSHVTAESEHTRTLLGVIESRLLSESAQRNLENIRKRILSTLWFSEMNQRENSIKEVSDDTALNIFPNSEFADWTRSNRQIFWISGKPGSGKSTLARYLVHNSQMIEYLRAWKSSVKLYRFYFYEVGQNPLQRRLRGCLRTLLHQVICSSSDALNCLLQDRLNIERKESEHDWSQRELSDALSTCLRGMKSGSCLFLDGLDEAQCDDRSDIIELMARFQGMSNVKICVTSRPEKYFIQNLGKYPTLRVQDLTKSAIHSYIKEVLGKYRATYDVLESDFESLSALIAQKSQGVFLWVVIALKDLCRGIEAHGDSWELLKRRIKMFPPNLNELYEKMWARQNHDLPIHKSEAAMLFRYVLKGELLNILVVLLATSEILRGKIQRFITSKGLWSSNERKYIYKEFEMWLSARSAGLIEILDVPQSFGHSTFFSEVAFIHRSVREFLYGTKYGQHILCHDDRPAMAQCLAYSNATREVAYILASHDSACRLGTLAKSEALEQMYNYLSLSERKGWKSYRKWMPPTNMNHGFLQTILQVNAMLGNVDVLDEIHQMDKSFESLSSEERGMVLFFCCKDLRDVAIRIQNRPIYLENADEQGPFKVEVSPKGLLEGLLKVLERQMTCIKWLLVHGSDAHMVIDEEDVELGRSPTRHTRLIRPTAFQSFHLNLLLLSYDILHSYPALSDDVPLSPHEKKTFHSHLRAYANIFNGHGIDEEDINLFCRISRQSRLYRVVYSINTVCFREAINMVAASIEEFTILKYTTLSSSIIKLFSTYGHIVDIRLESGKWLSTEEIIRLNPMELLNLAVQELFT